MVVKTRTVVFVVMQMGVSWERIASSLISTLKMEVICWFKMLKITYKIPCYHNPKIHNPRPQNDFTDMPKSIPWTVLKTVRNNHMPRLRNLEHGFSKVLPRKPDEFFKKSLATYTKENFTINSVRFYCRQKINYIVQPGYIDFRCESTLTNTTLHKGQLV